MFCVVLFIHIYRHAGLEFQGEFTFVNGDLFNQPPDKLFVVIGKKACNTVKVIIKERE